MDNSGPSTTVLYHPQPERRDHTWILTMLEGTETDATYETEFDWVRVSTS